MCKIISSDVVIGNFLLEAIERDTFNVLIEDMVIYDEDLSWKLNKYNYFTRFDYEKVLDFTENYPFFAQIIESNYIRIMNKMNNKDKLREQLGRYFRIGIPTLVVNEIRSVSDSVLGMR